LSVKQAPEYYQFVTSSINVLLSFAMGKIKSNRNKKHENKKRWISNKFLQDVHLKDDLRMEFIVY